MPFERIDHFGSNLRINGPHFPKFTFETGQLLLCSGCCKFRSIDIYDCTNKLVLEMGFQTEKWKHETQEIKRIAENSLA